MRIRFGRPSISELAASFRPLSQANSTLLAVLTLLAGCANPSPASSSQASQTDHNAETGDILACTFASEEAPPPPLLLKGPASSLLAVHMVAPISDLERQVEGIVPVNLAAERRKPVGAPGLATFNVARGPVVLSADKGTLIARTDVRAHVEVCKPLGPLCPTYFSCDPRFAVETTMPLMPGSDWSMGPARVAIRPTTGCSAGGIDMTPKMMTMVNKQASQVERRINGSVPDLVNIANAVWTELHRPLRTANGCVQFTPSAWSVKPLASQAATITTALSVRGELQVTRECAAPKSSTRPPKLTPFGDASPVVNPARHLSLDTLEGELRRLVEDAAPAEGFQTVTVQLAQAEAGAVVALGLDSKQCGKAWMLLTPKLIDGKVGFGSVELYRPDALTRAAAAPAWFAGLRSALIAFRAEVAELGDDDLSALVDRAKRLLPSDRDIKLELGWQPGPRGGAVFGASTDSLMVWEPRSGRLDVNLIRR